MFLRSGKNSNTAGKKRYQAILNTLAGTFILAAFTFSLPACQEEDEVPPEITLNGDDSVTHILNQVYNDQGAKALDDMDGDISSEVFTDNQVNVDLIGEYFVYYKVVDDGGNESNEIKRYVEVVNEARTFGDNYFVSLKEIFTGADTCSYFTIIREDSTVNNRIVFTNFGCDYEWPVYATIEDTTLIIPYQKVEDTILRYFVQGSGTISDSSLSFQYSKITDTITTYWSASYVRQ